MARLITLVYHFVRIKNNTAFSLLEVLLASIIFIITIAGVFATLSAVRAPIVNKESALTAAVFGKQVLETLRAQVNDPQGAPANYYTCSVAGQNPCQDFALSVGVHQVTSNTLSTAGGLTWPSSLVAKNTTCDPKGCLIYTVTCADGNSADCVANTDVAHKVDLNINW